MCACVCERTAPVTRTKVMLIAHGICPWESFRRHGQSSRTLSMAQPHVVPSAALHQLLIR